MSKASDFKNVAYSEQDDYGIAYFLSELAQVMDADLELKLNELWQSVKQNQIEWDDFRDLIDSNEKTSLIYPELKSVFALIDKRMDNLIGHSGSSYYGGFVGGLFKLMKSAKMSECVNRDIRPAVVLSLAEI